MIDILVQGAAAGSWPAAFAISVIAVSIASAVGFVMWCFSKAF